MNQTMQCPICEVAGSSRRQGSSKTDPNPQWNYDCPRCGRFVASDALIGGNLVDLSAKQRAVLSYRLRRQQRAGSAPPSILKNDLPQVDDPLPSPAEQADNLIVWIGDHQPSPAQQIEISDPEVSSWIGTAITPNYRDEGLAWLLRQPQMTTLVENNASLNSPNRLLLTFKGWQRYEALKHDQVESRSAFMAMKFGDDELNRVVNDCFKPAVKATDFELRILTDGQPAGLIDDQLRVALRTVRFVIADLTHGSNGAYWEAGFAEGLGRPVIYTCRKEEWGANKSHFDTSHLNTIIWDPENLQDAAVRLKATIRATLPAEAKMTD
jgi:hypothetical protein